MGVSVLKKLFILILALAILPLAAGDATALKLRIVENLAHLLVQKEPVPKVYIDPRLGLPLKSGDLSIRPVRDCKEAQILFVTDIDTLAKECPLDRQRRVVTFSYRDYLRHRALAAGAFFWQKGRPNIVINAEAVKRYRLHIPRAYEKYVE